jgi:hypothetical protein
MVKVITEVEDFSIGRVTCEWINRPADAETIDVELPSKWEFLKFYVKEIETEFFSVGDGIVERDTNNVIADLDRYDFDFVIQDDNRGDWRSMHIYRGRGIFVNVMFKPNTVLYLWNEILPEGLALYSDVIVSALEEVTITLEADPETVRDFMLENFDQPPELN